MKEETAIPPHPPSGSLPPPAWEALFEAIEDGVCVLSPDAVIVRANRAFAALSGLSPAQIIGRSCAEIFSCIDETPAHFCQRLLSEAAGRSASAEISGRLPGQRLRARLSPVCDDAGTVTAFVMVVRDITDVVAQEREMSRLEQLARFSELAAGLAHEIRNPLAGIQGAMDILLQRSSPFDAGRAVLERVRHEVRRIDATISILLERARPRGFRLRPASLSEAVQRAISIARHQAAGLASRTGRQIRVDFTAPPHPVIMLLDAAQIEDAVLSLLCNAIEAIEGNGIVGVRLQASAINNNGAGEVWLEVNDNGRGIAPEDLPHIFSPFFTTRPEGTGLGLPAVRRIVRAHNGTIEVSSLVSQGSLFTIRLPYRTPAQ